MTLYGRAGIEEAAGSGGWRWNSAPGRERVSRRKAKARRRQLLNDFYAFTPGSDVAQSELEQRHANMKKQQQDDAEFIKKEARLGIYNPL